MGEIRAKVRLTNAVDAISSRSGGKRRRKPRSIELDATVDTGAVMSVIPIHIAEKLGIQIGRHRMARYTDGRTGSVGVTDPILFEILGRDTYEEALVLGDELLIGQTVLEKLDLLADCAGRQLMPHPDRPNQPVITIR